MTNFFFNLFLLMSTKRIWQWILAIGSHFWIKRGQRGQKRYFYRICRFVIFHLIWMGFFSFDSSLKELWVVCQWIWCSYYSFRDIKGQKGATSEIVTFIIFDRVFIFYPILMCFFFLLWIVLSKILCPKLTVSTLTLC